MKVVHLEAGTHLYGGALQVLLLVEGLVSRGVENTLVVPRGSHVEEEALRKGIPTRALPMAGEADVTFPFRFGRLLREQSPDLAHLHSRRGADTLGALAARAAGIPSVLSRRVDNPEPEWSLGAKYRLYDAVITISEAIRGVLVEQGVPDEKIHCVHSALDPAPFQAPCREAAFQAEFGIGGEGPVVGMAAQFIRRKGHHVLLEAVPRVLEAHPRARFLLFGRGSLLEEMTDRVGRSGLAEHVFFAGFRDDLPRLLPCLDVLVHPALREGLGIILLQASASAVPVVASRAGGIPEAVMDGETGILVPPGDPAALASALSSLLSGPERARAMGRAGRALVRERFSVDRMVEGNLAVYRKVLAETTPEVPFHG